MQGDSQRKSPGPKGFAPCDFHTGGPRTLLAQRPQVLPKAEDFAVTETAAVLRPLSHQTHFCCQFGPRPFGGLQRPSATPTPVLSRGSCRADSAHSGFLRSPGHRLEKDRGSAPCHPGSPAGPGALSQQNLLLPVLLARPCRWHGHCSAPNTVALSPTHASGNQNVLFFFVGQKTYFALCFIIPIPPC